MHAHTNEEQRITEKRGLKAPNVDMTPMIDCVFLLIIFFMLATTFAPLPGIRVKLPPPGQPSREKPKGLILRISNPVAGDESGVMILNNEIVSLDNAFGVFMNTAAEEKEMLIIQSGRQVIHDQIVQVMDRAKRAGVQKIGFAMVQ